MAATTCHLSTSEGTRIMSTSPASPSRRRYSPFVALALVAVCIPASPGAGAPALPNISPRLAAPQPGETPSVGVTVAVTNTRLAKSRPGVLRFALSRNGRFDPSDVLIAGGTKVPALGTKKRASVRATVVAPVGTAAGNYSVLACVSPQVGAAITPQQCKPTAKKLTITPATAQYIGQAWADAETLPDTASAGMKLQLAGAVACTPVPGAKAPMSFAAAQAAVTTLLRQKAGNAAVSALLAGPLARDPKAAGQAAVAGALSGKSYASLAALVAAQRSDPGNPTVLVSTAVLLTELDRPREALAMMDQAQRLGAPALPPLGFSWQAVLDNNRGYALLRSGQVDAARAAFVRAATAEPLLSEARFNLAVADVCAKKDPGALIPAVQTGMLRKFDVLGGPGGGDPIKTGSSDRLRLPSALVFDLSRGKPMHLPNLVYPITTGDSLSALPKYEALRDRGMARMTARIAAQDALRPKVLPGGRTSRERRLKTVLSHIISADAEPSLAPLYQAKQKQNDAVGAAWAEWWDKGVYVNSDALPPDEFRTWCQASMPGGQAKWISEVRALDQASRRWFDAWHPHVSGLAANLSTPEAREYARLQIEEIADGVFYGQMVANVVQWAALAKTWGDLCITGSGSSDQQPAEPDVPAPDECNPVVQANPSVQIGFVETGLDCDNLELEASAGFGPVSGFVAVEGNPRTGRTIIIGSKGEVVGPGVSPKYGAKSGFYVTTDPQGEVTDFGWRVKLEKGAAAGPVSIKTWTDTMDFTFIGIFQP
jgi:hypothetical protein